MTAKIATGLVQSFGSVLVERGTPHLFNVTIEATAEDWKAISATLDIALRERRPISIVTHGPSPVDQLKALGMPMTLEQEVRLRAICDEEVC